MAKGIRVTQADLRALVGRRCECVQSALRRTYPGIIKRAYEDESVPCFCVTFTDEVTHYFDIPAHVQDLLECVDTSAAEANVPIVLGWPELEQRCREQVQRDAANQKWREHERTRGTAVQEDVDTYAYGTLRVEIREDAIEGHIVVSMKPVGPVALMEIMRKQRALKVAGFTMNKQSLWIATNTPDHRAAVNVIA